MSLQEWIAKPYCDEQWLQEAAQKYTQAQPYPHMQIQQFLRLEKYAALREAVHHIPLEEKDGDLFSLRQSSELATQTEGIIGEFVALLNSKAFREWIQTLTGVETETGKIDVFAAAYHECDYLICHDDQLGDRKIAFIVYLDTLTKEQGGGLAIYDDIDGHPGTKVHVLQPQANAVALFTVSETSWHEVEEVTAQVERGSLGGWLRG